MSDPNRLHSAILTEYGFKIVPLAGKIMEAAAPFAQAIRSSRMKGVPEAIDEYSSRYVNEYVEAMLDAAADFAVLVGSDEFFADWCAGHRGDPVFAGLVRDVAQAATREGVLGPDGPRDTVEPKLLAAVLKLGEWRLDNGRR